MKSKILARVSDKDQDSNTAQVERLRDFAKSKGFINPEEIEIKESSTKADRKKFYEKIIEPIRHSKEPVALFIDTIDRLQRSFRESVELDDLRKAGKVELYFCRENLHLHKESNSADLIRWDMGVMFARSYVLQLSDNVKRQNEQRRREGKICGPAPLGYLNTVDKNEDSTVTVDPDRGNLVTKMFELYASGQYSVKLLAKKMKEQGLKSREGFNLTSSQVEHTLKNPFYYGVMRYKGQLYPHHYEPLISRNLFEKVQDVFKSWHKQPTKYASKPFALRGLMTCADCGCTYSPEIKKGKFVYYSCTNYHRTCKREYVPEDTLLKPVRQKLHSLKLPQSAIDELVAKLKATAEAENHFHKDAMDSLKREYDQVEVRVKRLLNLLVDGSITKDNYDNMLKDYKQTQANLLLQMEEHSAADESFYLTAGMVLELARRAEEIFESSEPDEKQQLLKFLLQNCRVKDKNLLFELKTPFEGISRASVIHNWLPG